MKDLKASEVTQLQEDGKKLVIDFWAPWCGPCKTLIPRLENIESEYSDIQFVKVNVEEERDFAVLMGIRNVPTVILSVGTEEFGRVVGARPDSEYTSVLDRM
mgnify:CR=1 FL=1